jgi:hypothetical protein
VSNSPVIPMITAFSDRHEIQVHYVGVPLLWANSSSALRPFGQAVLDILAQVPGGIYVTNGTNEGSNGFTVAVEPGTDIWASQLFLCANLPMAPGRPHLYKLRREATNPGD